VRCAAINRTRDVQVYGGPKALLHFSATAELRGFGKDVSGTEDAGYNVHSVPQPRRRFTQGTQEPRFATRVRLLKTRHNNFMKTNRRPISALGSAMEFARSIHDRAFIPAAVAYQKRSA
jgi:hypothetical protein